MANEILWFLFILVDLTLAVFAFYLWRKNGAYAMIAMSTIICNIQVIKTVRLFGIVATLGNVVYASIFFNTDILSEIYGKDAARRGVWIGFYTLLASMLLMQLAIRFVPDVSDWAQPHLASIFNFFPRVVLASLSGYLLSQHHDVWAFHFWKEKTKGRYLWLRNNASTMVSQLIDSIVFCLIAFYGIFELKVFLQILLTTYLFKWIVAAIDTPFLYLARLMVRRC
ncbi:VUT family protein [candidate division WOR-3 bacterium]|uniref:Probable queuosine precursor transporter n=1 Tax=candidate division WOR-3 bacterium TaxID=2052148 RepID=A0A660SHH9_UNCW3|nr:MAG: VUT family protein [candidate division WOR-3 bacterium]